MSRFRDAETLAETVRAEIPSMAVTWLAALRAPLEKLTMAALDEGVSDEEFLNRIDDFIRKIPNLLEEMDSEALAELMEGAMGAAMANGIAERLKTSRPQPQDED